MAMVPAFAVVALVTAVPLVAFLRNVDRGPPALPAGPPPDQADRVSPVPTAALAVLLLASAALFHRRDA